MEWSKCLVYLSSVLIMLFGLAGIIVSLASFTNLSVFKGDIEDTLKILKFVILILSIVLFLTGLMGFFGTKNQKTFLLSLYAIIVAVLAVAFLIVGIVGLSYLKSNKYTQQLTDKLQQQSPSNPFYQQQYFVNQSSLVLCSSDCPCNADSDIQSKLQKAWDNYSKPARNLSFQTADNTLRFLSNEYQKYIFLDSTPSSNTTNSTNNNSSSGSSNNSSTSNNSSANSNNHATTGSSSQLVFNKSGAIRIQDCPNYKQIPYYKYIYITSLAAMESSFECTGIWNPTPFYLFSNINEDSDDIGEYPSCQSFIQDNFKSYAIKVGATCFVLFVILLLNAISGFYQICKKREEPSDNKAYTELQRN